MSQCCGLWDFVHIGHHIWPNLTKLAKTHLWKNQIHKSWANLGSCDLVPKSILAQIGIYKKTSEKTIFSISNPSNPPLCLCFLKQRLVNAKPCHPHVTSPLRPPALAVVRPKSPGKWMGASGQQRIDNNTSMRPLIVYCQHANQRRCYWSLGWYVNVFQSASLQEAAAEVSKTAWRRGSVWDLFGGIAFHQLAWQAIGLWQTGSID